MKQVSNDESSPAAEPRIQSVARACRILLFVAQNEDKRAKDVALAQGLPLATTHHLLATLVAEGILSKDSGRRYRLGPKVGVLSEAFSSGEAIPEQYMMALRKLATLTGETTYLSGWYRDEIRVLAIVEGSHAVRVAGLDSGYQGNAHARASGKLLLALSRPDRREGYLRTHPLRALTRRTIVDARKLEREFVRIRSQGYALDQGEFADGVACVSAPLSENDVAIAAVTLSAPLERFLRNKRQLIEAVLTVSQSLTSEVI